MFHPFDCCDEGVNYDGWRWFLRNTAREENPKTKRPVLWPYRPRNPRGFARARPARV